MNKQRGDNYKVTGYWGGEPIMRPKTAEEKLQEAGIAPEVGRLFIGLNEYPDSFKSAEEQIISEDLKN